MDKKLIILGLAGAGLIGYLFLSSGSDTTPGAGGGGGKKETSEPGEPGVTYTPYVFNFEQPEFPMFDFSLPDPYNLGSSSGSTKKSSKKYYPSSRYSPETVERVTENVESHMGAREKLTGGSKKTYSNAGEVHLDYIVGKLGGKY